MIWGGKNNRSWDSRSRHSNRLLPVAAGLVWRKEFRPAKTIEIVLSGAPSDEEAKNKLQTELGKIVWILLEAGTRFALRLTSIRISILIAPS
jgi:hypothetical protein